ncbi:fumarylacetoacetate hydrolase family protein [Rathayibacter sp. CAU 1779]
MRLASFLTHEEERWGFVVTSPLDSEDWILEPARVEATLARMSSVRTSGFAARHTSFDPQNWPRELADVLAEGEPGMARLRDLQDFVLRFLDQSDQTLLAEGGCRVADVELLAPVPRPGLVWGLVTNSPSFVRNNPGISVLNLIPLGHQRPQGSVIGAGRPVIMENGHHLPWFAYNVELGVVIGKGGRDIPLERAMEHVAGFTVVNDVSGSHYFRAANEDADPSYRLPAEYDDWFAQVTASWAGKMADAMCPIGPYLVTKDEVGDPYDLLVWTRQDGLRRDRSHTAGTLMGIERVISWYSSFAALHPGDIIHFGTMGVDGLPVGPGAVRRGDCTLGAEIERVGTLVNPVELADPDADDDPSEHPSFAVRQLARDGGGALVDPTAWMPKDARHLYTAFGNHATTEFRPIAQPRFLSAPASALSRSGDVVELPSRATELTAAVELCLVVGRLTHRVSVEDAFDHLLGLAPMLSLTDRSLGTGIAKEGRAAERAIPAVYGRWADGFNVVGPITRVAADDWSDSTMTVDAVGATGSATTGGYVASPSELVSAISSMITLFPGDVISLGSTAAVVELSALENDGARIVAHVDGLGSVECSITRSILSLE